MVRAAAFALMLALLLPTAARAQRAATPPPQAAVPEALLQAPYEPQLLRLAEIMGALHYLRMLCTGPETGAWRREMQALLDAEASSAERRERLTLRFNRGYAGFEQTHRSCTPAAQVATRRYLDEGQRIVADITSRFVN
ncbi:MAG: TIGR02301 family protein [Phreatobacter sp.]